MTQACARAASIGGAAHTDQVEARVGLVDWADGGEVWVCQLADQRASGGIDEVDGVLQDQGQGQVAGACDVVVQRFCPPPPCGRPC